MICALLVFQTPDLPAPLPELSPWLNPLGIFRSDVYDRLAAQEHRRFVKTHLTLSEIPVDSRVAYIVLARDPLDSAISLFHQTDTATRARMSPGADSTARGRPPGPSPRDYLLRWIDAEALPQVRRESLPGVMCHLSDAWARRGEPNVVLFHYEDLSADLEREMRRLAAHLGITVAETKWPRLVEAATLEQMRAAAGRIQPLPTLKDEPAAYFRRGTSGSGREFWYRTYPLPRARRNWPRPTCWPGCSARTRRCDRPENRSARSARSAGVIGRSPQSGSILTWGRPGS
jgi:aryl sulfotransferase